MLKKQPFRIFLIFVAMVLAVVLLLLFILPAQERFTIVEVNPLEGETLSAYGRIGMTFDQPMDHAGVEAAFAIQPAIEGRFFWVGNRFWFQPLTAFDPAQTYQARLSGNLHTAAGETVAVDQSWSLRIRQPELIYFQPLDPGGELWLMNLEDGSTTQLTQTGGKVVDFAADRPGEQIAYTVLNDAGGSDLWIMDRDGQNIQALLDCGPDVCSEPDWSIDSQVIAYTREVYQPATGGFQAGQVWTLMTATGETAQLYQSEVAFGFNPSFSPDGKRLATYDTTHEGIRILDLETSQESILPRVLLGSGDWSPDGSSMVFTDLVPALNEPEVVVYLADLDTQDVRAVFGQTETGTDFSQPRWSPAGGWLAVSLRPVNAGVSKALWLLNLNGSDKVLIADEPSATFSAYSWDPWGERLAYQRLALGSSNLESSIWLWDWDSGESRRLADDAARPVWLP